MGILSDFFIADRSAVPDYCGGEDFDTSERRQFQDLSPLQCAQFLAVLRGEEYVVSMIEEFVLVTPEAAEEWTMSVPQDMIDKLAAIQTHQVSEVASCFARATEVELGWSTDDFVEIVIALNALARRAIESNKAMYLWNSL